MGDLLYTVVFYFIHGLILGALYTVVGWVFFRLLSKPSPSIPLLYFVSFVGAVVAHWSLIWLTPFVMMLFGYPYFLSAFGFVVSYIAPFLMILFFFLFFYRFLWDLRWSRALLVSVILLMLTIPLNLLAYLLLTPIIPIIWVIKSWPGP